MAVSQPLIVAKRRMLYFENENYKIDNYKIINGIESVDVIILVYRIDALSA